MRATAATLASAVFIALGLLAAAGGGCSGISQTFQPLPAANTLGLQAALLPGEAVAGSRNIHISWTPPSDDSAELIVIEESRQSSEGPWEEIATLSPARGSHREAAIYRPGRAYYFRAFLVRGNEDGTPTQPIRVWVPYEPQKPTNTPLPTYTPVPTPMATADPAAEEATPQA